MEYKGRKCWEINNRKGCSHAGDLNENTRCGEVLIWVEMIEVPLVSRRIGDNFERPIILRMPCNNLECLTSILECIIKEKENEKTGTKD